MNRTPLSARDPLRVQFAPTSHDAPGLALSPGPAVLTSPARFVGMCLRAAVLLTAISLFAVALLIGIVVDELTPRRAP